MKHHRSKVHQLSHLTRLARRRALQAAEENPAGWRSAMYTRLWVALYQAAPKSTPMRPAKLRLERKFIELSFRARGWIISPDRARAAQQQAFAEYLGK